MQRFADGMYGEGEKLFPRMVNGQMVGLDEVAEQIERDTSFKRSDVVGVLSEFIYRVRLAMSDGDSVKIDGLGTFHPVLGLVEKGRRGSWTDAAGRVTTERNVRLKSIAFSADKRLVSDVRAGMDFAKADDSAVNGVRKIGSSVEERAAKARAYLASNGYMRVADYAALTGLSYSMAAKELRLLADDATSGITSRGQKAAKLYVLRTE